MKLPNLKTLRRMDPEDARERLAAIEDSLWDALRRDAAPRPVLAARFGKLHDLWDRLDGARWPSL